jgi:hypothetical protein
MRYDDKEIPASIRGLVKTNERAWALYWKLKDTFGDTNDIKELNSICVYLNGLVGSDSLERVIRENGMQL